MTAIARANGWKGFEDLGERVEGGWLYRCDGLPTYMGCSAEVVVPRRWSRVGLKTKSGWLVTYGYCDPNDPDDPADDKDGNDLDVVLTYCPRCAKIVLEQDKRRETLR